LSFSFTPIHFLNVIAKEGAHIPKEHAVTIIEMPKKGFIDFSKFMPNLFSVEFIITNDPTAELLKFRIQHDGKPLPMLTKWNKKSPFSIDKRMDLVIFARKQQRSKF
jgi:hypothetical protein